MSRFILPTRVGPELLVRQTAVPARVVVVGVNRSDSARQLIENRYMGQVTSFYMRQTQMRSLSTLNTYVGRERVDGITYTLLSLFGVDTITVEVPLGEPKKIVNWPVVLRIRSTADSEGSIQRVPVGFVANGTYARLVSLSEGGGLKYSGAVYNWPQDEGINEYQGALGPIPWAGIRFGGYLVDMRRMEQLGLLGPEEFTVNFYPVGVSGPAVLQSGTWAYSLVQRFTRTVAGYSTYDHDGNTIAVVESYNISMGATLPGVFDKYYRALSVPVDPDDDPVLLGYTTIEGVDNRYADYLGRPVLNQSQIGFGDLTGSGVVYPSWAIPYDGSSEMPKPLEIAQQDLNAQSLGSVTIMNVPENYHDFGPPPFSLPITDPGIDDTMYLRRDPVRVYQSRSGPIETILDEDRLWEVKQTPPLEMVVELVQYAGLVLDDIWERMQEVLELNGVSLTRPQADAQMDLLYGEMVARLNSTVPQVLYQKLVTQTYPITYVGFPGGARPDLIRPFERAELDYQLRVEPGIGAAVVIDPAAAPPE